ncbi:hypothetical protein TNCT_268362 [Trichonephila clavata]|uniref:Uncharacterized protein n=1 Tax=Trichonephila clavata TaxID=2740835 RepID=A0A8X6F5G4_TRICU|nr:hypothetical protein TNCT_268362 [Trichonephila clavata]
MHSHSKLIPWMKRMNFGGTHPGTRLRKLNQEISVRRSVETNSTCLSMNYVQWLHRVTERWINHPSCGPQFPFSKIIVLLQAIEGFEINRLSYDSAVEP